LIYNTIGSSRLPCIVEIKNKVKQGGRDIMSKTIRTVFLIIGTLVLIFIAWQLIFNDGGILKTMYNGIANGLNCQWNKVTGDTSSLIPTWGSNASSNGQGFNIDIK
jgi:hypothetical protein